MKKKCIQKNYEQCPDCGFILNDYLKDFLKQIEKYLPDTDANAKALDKFEEECL